MNGVLLTEFDFETLVVACVVVLVGSVAVDEPSAGPVVTTAITVPVAADEVLPAASVDDATTLLVGPLAEALVDELPAETVDAPAEAPIVDPVGNDDSPVEPGETELDGGLDAALVTIAVGADDPKMKDVVLVAEAEVGAKEGVLEGEMPSHVSEDSRLSNVINGVYPRLWIMDTSFPLTLNSRSSAALYNGVLDAWK